MLKTRTSNGASPLFIAIQRSNNRRITSIAPEWRGREDELRSLARDGEAVCSGCQQLLWFRFNEAIEDGKRPHFAHRHKVDCRLPQQSAEVMEAKAQLYEWLLGKYPEAVDLDVDVELGTWDKPADVVVKDGEQVIFAFWVFDRAVRERFKLCLQESEIPFTINIVHTEKAHEQVEHLGIKCLALTASQRDFAQFSRLDLPFGRQPHLHFLETTTGELKIYRGLTLAHGPNLFNWGVLRTGQLKQAKICPTTGEPVFDEDVAEYQRWKQKEEERKSREEEQSRAAEIQRKMLEKIRLEQQVIRPNTKALLPNISRNDVEPDSWKRFIGPFRCTKCGIMTTKWATATPDNGICVCSDCSRANRK